MNLFCASALGLMFGASAALAGPLHDAAKDGDVERTKQLLDQGVDVAEPDAAGEPALLIASLAGHADIVALLLERGSDIEIRNKGGLTALHAAAYGGNLDVVELLVAKGAAVNDQRISIICRRCMRRPRKATRMWSLSCWRTRQISRQKERNGYTPLSQAGWREHWDAAGLLMKAGAVCQKADLVGEWLYTECTKRK